MTVAPFLNVLFFSSSSFVVLHKFTPDFKSFSKHPHTFFFLRCLKDLEFDPPYSSFQIRLSLSVSTLVQPPLESRCSLESFSPSLFLIVSFGRDFSVSDSTIPLFPSTEILKYFLLRIPPFFLKNFFFFFSTFLGGPFTTEVSCYK